MIHTRICELFDIAHPIVLGGMGSATSPQLVAAVSNAGGLGTLGTSGRTAAQIIADAKAIREATDKPFGINHLLFRTSEEAYAATLEARPEIVAFAWANSDQDLHGYFKRAHDAGAKVMSTTLLPATYGQALWRACNAMRLSLAGRAGNGRCARAARRLRRPSPRRAVAETPTTRR